jgi:hypothetical protein
MRNGQKRMRGRGGNNNHRKSQNPLTRVYESNGPDVKIRGTASHIAEKYIQLARDSQSSGDPVAAENYYQHAEHYYRLIATAQEQFRQQNPYYNQQQGLPQGAADDNFDDEGDDQPFMGQNEPSFVQREPQPQPQPYLPREGQPFPNQQIQHARPQQQSGYPQPQPQPEHEPNGLPAFITGGAPGPQPVNGNGHDQGERNDRFGGHHRRRRRRGGYRADRPDVAGQGADQGDGPGQAE